MIRVDIGEIEFHDNWSFTLNGNPFTGIACEHDSNGNLLSEIQFANGMKEGPSVEYFPSGRKAEEDNYHQNTLDGESRSWSDRGLLLKRTVYESGYTLECDEWDESGKLVKSYRLAPEDPLYELLNLNRQAKKKAQ